MCMKIFSYLYAHIYVEFVLCIVGSLTLWSQWVWVPFCLCCCSRNKWRCIGCSAHSQGRCCHHVHIGVKLGWSMNYYLPSIGIYYILPMLTRQQVSSYTSCTHFVHQPCVGCITACYSFSLVILVSFLKASQQWSLVASCDVFDGCVVGIHLYTIRPYLAMCYASKQISYWYMYDFLLDILFLHVVTISGVHPSL